ncbi:MAG: hypothetical protein ACP5UL_03720 [Thermoplasmata archaeon]
MQRNFFIYFAILLVVMLFIGNMRVYTGSRYNVNITGKDMLQSITPFGLRVLNITSSTFDPNASLTYGGINVSGNGVLHLGNVRDENITVNQPLSGLKVAYINISQNGKIIIANGSQLITIGNVIINVMGNGVIQLNNLSIGNFSSHTFVNFMGNSSLYLINSGFSISSNNIMINNNNVEINNGFIGNNITGGTSNLTIKHANNVVLSHMNADNIKIYSSTYISFKIGVFRNINIGNSTCIYIGGTGSNTTTIYNFDVASSNNVTIANTSITNTKISSIRVNIGMFNTNLLVAKDMDIKFANYFNVSNMYLYNFTANSIIYSSFSNTYIYGNGSDFSSISNIAYIYALQSSFYGKLNFINQKVIFMNTSAYSLNISGKSNVTLYNWQKSSMIQNVPYLQNISLTGDSRLQVFRDIVISVKYNGVIYQNGIVGIQQLNGPQSPVNYYRTNRYGVLSIFLETDIWSKNTSGDTFVGYYKIIVNGTSPQNVILTYNYTLNININTNTQPANNEYNIILVMIGIIMIAVVLAAIYIFYIRLDYLHKKSLRKKGNLKEWTQKKEEKK